MRYSTEVAQLAEAVLEGPGHTPTTLRRAVAARSARLGGAPWEDTPLPENLERYVEKVALYAYKVIDGDIAALRAAGYSEEAIYEITVAASLGASLARMEKGHAVLRGAR